MENNYDRIELLNQALAFRNHSAELLCNRMDMPIMGIHESLQEGDPVRISQIASALDIPEAFFYGGLRLENGELVPNDPS